MINVKDGRMLLRIGEEEVMFKLREAMRHSMNFNDDTCYYVDVIADYVSDFMQGNMDEGRAIGITRKMNLNEET